MGLNSHHAALQPQHGWHNRNSQLEGLFIIYFWRWGEDIEFLPNCFIKTCRLSTLIFIAIQTILIMCFYQYYYSLCFYIMRCFENKLSQPTKWFREKHSWPLPNRFTKTSPNHKLWIVHEDIVCRLIKFRESEFQNLTFYRKLKTCSIFLKLYCYHLQNIHVYKT